MPKCPNCFFELVLLKHRRKYKCTKCSKLFLQRVIEDKEFVAWNKRRRLEEKVKVGKALKKPKKKIQKISIKEGRKRQRETYKKNRKEILKKLKLYYGENRGRLLKRRREYYKIKKEHILKTQEKYRAKNKTLARIKNLRNRQKILALRKLESGG